MNKITTALAASHRVSLAAMEEASRLGLRTADIDHMLLALTLDPGAAGDALRSLGVTLASAREAVVAQHAEQLISLGISPADAPAGPIVFHETGGYEWSQAALAVMKQASSGKNRGDSAAMLRALVAEPSGMIESTLGRIGIPPDTVLARLDAAESAVVPSQDDSIPDSNTNSTIVAKSISSHVAASAAEVWALVSDPARIPEWDPSIASVASGSTPLMPGESRIARARVERPDGGRIRIKPEFTRVSIELVALEHPSAVEWQFSYPDSARANKRRVTIHLVEAAGGTKLRLAYRWERTGARSSLRGLALRPLQRLATGMQASQLAAGIGRAFR